MSTQEFCTFTLDSHLYGVEVKQVQEVIRFQEMTRIPLSSPVVKGLINLRGQIVTAIDLRRRLGLDDRDPEALPMNVVVRQDDEAVSFLVDEIGDVVEVDDAVFERPPETLRGAALELICGAYKLEDGLLLVLDTDKAVDLSSTD